MSFAPKENGINKYMILGDPRSPQLILLTKMYFGSVPSLRHNN